MIVVEDNGKGRKTAIDLFFIQQITTCNYYDTGELKLDSDVRIKYNSPSKLDSDFSEILKNKNISNIIFYLNTK